MKRNILLSAVILLLVAAQQPSSAQIRLDMNALTCGEWLGYSPANRDFVRSWLSGYYSAAANNNVLDYNRMQINSAKVEAYCKRHRSDNLPTAIKKSAQ
jgi:acid stress chaperone HdeB